MQQLQTSKANETGITEVLEGEDQEEQSFVQVDVEDGAWEDAKPSFLSVLKNLVPGS